MKKTNAFQFFNKDTSVKHYSDMYKQLRLDIRYPANDKREQIFVKLLKKHNFQFLENLDLETGKGISNKGTQRDKQGKAKETHGNKKKRRKQRGKAREKQEKNKGPTQNHSKTIEKTNRN